ncbi:MAG: MgtC/SapB family protein [Clostridia bacterium]|nr:MgtC/SapB family protein [Clostridia bacterium]
MNNILQTLTEINAWSAVFRVFLAVLLGGFVGLERGHHGRAAGLRTHILVCLGAAVCTMVGLYTGSVLHFNNDPLRIGAQVVSGIGFLGVGTIMVRNSERVTGLTTAAGLWATACLGLAIGIGFYTVAIATFAAIMITMSVFIRLELSTKSKPTCCCYIEINDVSKVNGFYDEIKALISRADIIPAKSGMPAHVGLEVKALSLDQYEQLMQKTQENDDIVITLPIQK